MFHGDDAAKRRGMAVAGLLAGALAIGPAAAQQDRQTEEIRERDRRYYERQTQPDPEKPEAPAAEADEREALVRAFLEEADRLIRDRNHESKSTAHYRVQTDDPRLDPVAAADVLEAFRAFFEDFWAERVTLRPFDGGSRVFLFYSYFKYNQLLTGRKRFDSFRSSGHYRPFFDVVVIHTDSVAPSDLGATLVHEAAHQLMARQVVNDAGAEPVWVSEGIAAYFGYTARRPDGQFLPGAIGGKGPSIFRDAKSATEGIGPHRLQEMKRSLKKSGPPAVSDLLAMGPTAFYGEGIEEHYSLAWLLVHYLFHGEDGAMAGPFVSWLQAEAEEPQGAGALFEALGRSADDLSAGLRDYVLALRDRPAKG